MSESTTDGSTQTASRLFRSVGPLWGGEESAPQKKARWLRAVPGFFGAVVGLLAVMGVVAWPPDWELVAEASALLFAEIAVALAVIAFIPKSRGRAWVGFLFALLFVVLLAVPPYPSVIPLVFKLTYLFFVSRFFCGAIADWIETKPVPGAAHPLPEETAAPESL